MDRGWYIRFGVVVLAVLGSIFILLQTMNRIGWIGDHEEVSAAVRDDNADEYGTTTRFFAWLTQNVDRQITPGLDIQGGLRLMYTVDMDAAIEDRQRARAQQLLRRLGERLDIVEEGEIPDEEALAEIRGRVQAQVGDADSRLIVLNFMNEQTRAADMAEVDHDLITSFGDVVEEDRNATRVRLRLQEQSIEELRGVAVNQAQETIKSRIAELGISEANVRARDIDISVEVPGADETRFQQIREIISQTARLEFKITDDENTYVQDFPADQIPEGIERQNGGAVQVGESRTAPDVYFMASGAGACPEGEEPPEGEAQCSARQRLRAFVRTLETASDNGVPDGRQLAIGRMSAGDPDAEESEGDTVAWRTYLLYEQPPNGSDPVGGEHLEDARVGVDPQSQSPVVLFSMKTDGARLMAELTQGNLKRRMAVVLDDEVKSAPTIQSRIGASGQITLGGFRDFNSQQQEAQDLVIVLRAGALPAPIIRQNEQLIGPTLGADSVARGALGASISIVLVLIFMAVYYEVAGLVADTMVLLNLLFMMAIMAFFNSDLTLPGIAGIALTVGMAVDANVLITERMREELRMGKSARAAVDQGFGRAFWSIFDSQLTTFIAGVVLFQYGSPEIQGFAKMLMIGIATSLFTGVFCSRVMFDWIVRGLKVRRLRVG